MYFLHRGRLPFTEDESESDDGFKERLINNTQDIHS